MIRTPHFTYLANQRRSLMPATPRLPNITYQPPVKISKKLRVKEELKQLGVSSYGLRSEEARYLPVIIHDNEHVMGAVYGRCAEGFAMLLATDCRVIFLDKKPFLTRADELTYEVVTGVSYGMAGFFVTVTLHTRICDFTIRTMNYKCARGFIKYIESRRLEQTI